MAVDMELNSGSFFYAEKSWNARFRVPSNGQDHDDKHVRIPVGAVVGWLRLREARETSVVCTKDIVVYPITRGLGSSYVE